MFKFAMILFALAIFIAISTTAAQKKVYQRVVRYIPAQTARIVYRPLTPVQKSAKLQTEDSATSETDGEGEIFLGEAFYSSDVLTENEDDDSFSESSESESELEPEEESYSDEDDSFDTNFEGIPVDGVFFPISFGDPEGGSIAISNSFSSGKRGSSVSSSKSFGGSVETTIIN